jgi:hypothetical protein
MGVVQGSGLGLSTLDSRPSSLDSALPKPEAHAIRPKAGGHH